MIQEKFSREHAKIFIEYLRFLTTLSTGSIVILASFLERLEAQPNLGFLVGISLIAFMVSIVAAVIAYTAVLSILGSGAPSDRFELIGGFALVATWSSFLIAIISLTVFGLVNLY